MRQCEAGEGENNIWSMITPREIMICLYVSTGCVCTQEMKWLGRVLQINLPERLRGAGRGGND